MRELLLSETMLPSGGDSDDHHCDDHDHNHDHDESNGRREYEFDFSNWF